MVWVSAFLGDAHPGLVRVPDVPTSLGRGIWVLVHDDLRNTVRVRAFVDFLVKWIVARRSMFTE